MKPSRRQFLELSAKATAGLTLTAVLPACESFGVEGTLADSEFKFLTPPEEWFWYSFRDLDPKFSPLIPADEWSLDVRSGGKSVGEITYRKLKAMEDDGLAVNYLKTMRCLRGSYVSGLEESRTATGVFRGIPLRPLLDETSISGEAAKLRLAAEDGFTTSILYSRLLDETQLPVMLAFELNGRPIPPERGGPVRLIVPEMWAFKSIKWITAVDATTDASSFGYFETGNGASGAVDTPGYMALTALAQNPRATRAEITGPTLDLYGMALVGGARVLGVEVLIDDGTPTFATIPTVEEILESLGHDALLVRSTEQFGTQWPYQDIWVPWSHRIDIPPGRHKVVIRAVDSNGQANPSFTDNPAILAQHIELDLIVS